MWTTHRRVKTDPWEKPSIGKQCGGHSTGRYRDIKVCAIFRLALRGYRGGGTIGYFEEIEAGIRTYIEIFEGQ